MILRWIRADIAGGFCLAGKSRCASLLRSKACSIIPLKTIAYGNPRLVDYLHVTIWLPVTPPWQSGRSCECANIFMLGEAADFWLNRGTQRDGKSSVPPLKQNFVAFLPLPMRFNCFRCLLNGKATVSFRVRLMQPTNPTEMIEFRANILGRRQQI